MKFTSSLLFSFLIAGSFCLYGSGSKVISLDERDLKNKVLDSNELWFVEFFAPWCGHCKSLAPEYEKAAKALAGIVKLGAVDMDAHRNAGAAYNIQGFPTIKFFGANKGSPLDYNGARTAQAIVDFALSQVKATVSSRLSGGSGQKSSSSSSNSHSSSGNSSYPNMFDLTESDFASKTASGPTFVMFHAPWCGHCKRAMPDYEEASNELKGKVPFARVNCDEQKSLCGQHGVQGFPTFKFFTNGAPEDYQGARSREAFAEFAASKAGTALRKSELVQLTNEAVFEENCKNFEGLCILALLPDVRDSGESKRGQYLKELKEIVAANSRNAISFLWAQGGDHFNLEDKLNLNFGYPALVALHFGKKKYAVMRKLYDKKNIEAFIGLLTTGGAQVSDLPALPTLKEKKPAAPTPTEDL